MKVTKREQVLIGVLLIVLLGYSFYRFVYTKQIQKITELKASRDTYSQKWEQAKVKIASEDKRKKQYESLNSKILIKTDKLFPEIKQEEIIVTLDKMLEESNLEADVLDFLAVSSEKKPVATDNTSINELEKLVSEFNGTTIKDASGKTTNTDNLQVSSPYKMQLTLNFKGSYDELIAFIEKVELYNKKIIINNIKINETDGSDIEGSIGMDFNGVPKLNDNNEFKWDFKDPSGKGDPFLGSYNSLQGNKEIVTNETTNNPVTNNNQVNNPVNNPVNNQVNNPTNNSTNNPVNNDVKSDFVLRANPITADSKTVTIGTSKDETKQSYIYSHNKKTELVEFVFTKTGKEYFYKYKTSTKSYPGNFNNTVKFVPNGKDITLDIFSQKRGLDSDLSGADIEITNDTDKSLVVSILGDDKKKPRVKITREKGDISVIQNYIYYDEK